ncbi:hypothetical protein DERP_012444 [Dermatophagoides pteronyssinus]|uniref:Uncharacterized protein n=1 Tax=Dermatophagoides pteronyssinus TaxID=6956 RepID=A0ABQ8IX16_DERPT|nr:hypothetical protein DERP_012444 [Dermatophagoides pteronyssinus]
MVMKKRHAPNLPQFSSQNKHVESITVPYNIGHGTLPKMILMDANEIKPNAIALSLGSTQRNVNNIAPTSEVDIISADNENIITYNVNVLHFDGHIPAKQGDKYVIPFVPHIGSNLPCGQLQSNEQKAKRNERNWTLPTNAIHFATDCALGLKRRINVPLANTPNPITKIPARPAIILASPAIN